MMQNYVLLLRGVNVGGKNKLPMVSLKAYLEELGYANVATYIASGNVLLDSTQDAQKIKAQLERALTERFELDSELIEVLVLSREQLAAVVSNKPKGFGDKPGTYHSDVIFLIDCAVDEALTVFNPREGVDTIWPGEGVIYSQRLSALRTKSRLSKIVGTPAYQSMTIRSWNTTVKLLELLNARSAG